MKKIMIFIFLIIFSSCDRANKEYYSNGVLHKKYRLKNNLYAGVYSEFYKSGTLKVTHKYMSGRKIDTSYYYDENGMLREKRVWLDSLKDKVILYDNENKTAEGYITKGKKKINKWTYFKADKDSVVEYVIVDDSSYANQFWNIKKNGSTIWDESNDYKIYLSKKVIDLKDIVRVRLVLMDPYLNNLSDVKVLLFKDSDTLRDNFYSYKEVEKDTFLSLKNDGIPHPKVPKDILQNHIVEFGLKFENPGNKKIKGILREYSKGYLKNKPDSIIIFKKDLFFEKNINVMDDNSHS